VNAKRWFSLALLAVALVAVLARANRSSGRDAEPARPMPAETAPAERAGEVRSEPAAARDLAADEAAGGHTLRRHVGRNDDELRRRLAEERGISAASSFTDRATAERVVASTLAESAPRVERWLSGGGGNLALDYGGRSGETIGRTLARGARQPRPTGSARVVLRKIGGSRYFVLTAYPVEPE